MKNQIRIQYTVFDGDTPIYESQKINIVRGLQDLNRVIEVKMSPTDAKVSLRGRLPKGLFDSDHRRWGLDDL